MPDPLATAFQIPSACRAIKFFKGPAIIWGTADPNSPLIQAPRASFYFRSALGQPTFYSKTTDATNPSSSGWSATTITGAIAPLLAGMTDDEDPEQLPAEPEPILPRPDQDLPGRDPRRPHPDHELPEPPDAAPKPVRDPDEDDETRRPGESDDDHEKRKGRIRDRLKPKPTPHDKPGKG